jgi:uncharacterized protein (DUF1015 family)
MKQLNKDKSSKSANSFTENPYDMETVLESIKIASQNGIEILFMDKLICELRRDGDTDIIKISYEILEELKTLK